VIKKNWDRLSLSTQAVAITLLYTDQNRIIDADIVYNEEYYNFCTDIDSCEPTELHLPSIVLHEIGHQIGFDHSGLKPSIMQATIQFAVSRKIENTDESGAKCTYSKDVLTTSEYISACSKAESEGSIGGSKIFLSSTPTLSGCGTLASTKRSTRQPPPLLLIIMFGFVIFFFGLRKKLPIKNTR